MAIGDKPNQNLFGTNYNAEEEERKKAELAAQGAMMGAGVGTQDPLLRSFEDSLLKGQSQNNPFGQAGTQAGQEMANNIRESRGIPASAFGQAPAVAPFSMEAVGQVNPMMQPQNLESFAQPQVTFRDYDVPATPPASALSVFTPGGEVKPNVDVNAITPSPETTTEAAPKNALLEMLERGDERQSMGLPRQAAPGIIDAPVETPSVGAQGQGMDMNQSAIMNALTDQNQGMDMNQQAIANAQGQEATVPPPAQTLSQFMRYEDAPEQRTEQFVDEQGRLRFRPTQEALQLQAQGAVAQPPVDSAVSPTVAQPPVDALSSFEKDSLARQQRIGGTGSFEGDSEAREARLRENERRPGESQADRDTRVAQSKTTGGQTGGLSFDDARRIAEGQLAARGVKNPSVSQINDLSRAIQAQGPASLTPSEQLARERFEFDKEQALIGDDTSDNATTRKIATIKQANPDISDADAAAIASGSVKVVTNDLTGVTQLLNIATGESKQIQSQPAPAVDFDVALPEKTLFSRAGDFTGFVEATKRKAQGITGQVGLDVATKESLEAAQDFETAQNELVRAFRESSRYAASEAAALKKELDISLSPFKDPKSAEAKLRSIDKSLARRYENEVATFRDTTFPPSDRQDARMRAKAIAEFRANLGVPPEGQGSTSSTQGKVPQGVDPKDWAFMTEEQRNLFN